MRLAKTVQILVFLYLVLSNLSYGQTSGDDIVYGTGFSRAVESTIVNPFTNSSIEVNGNYEVYNSFINGLEGYDAWSGSSNADLVSVTDSSGNIILESIEVYLLGNGNDIIIMADGQHTYAEDLLIYGGSGNDILWGVLEIMKFADQVVMIISSAALVQMF